MRLESYNTTSIFPYIALPRNDWSDRALIPLGCLIYVSSLVSHMCVFARAREI